MRKWSLLAAGLAWAVSMAYEWLWCGGSPAPYIGWGGLVLAIMVGLFLLDSLPRNRRKPADPPPMVWFLLAALVCALFYSALGRAVELQPPHVQLMPLYFILFLDFFLTGCYTWWKKKSR